MSSPCSVHAKAIELGKQALKMTTAAGSGHPTSALSLAHIVVELMYRQMRYDPRDPWNPHTDRLVLSEGHAVPIVYAAYADLGGAVGLGSISWHRIHDSGPIYRRRRLSVLRAGCIQDLRLPTTNPWRLDAEPLPSRPACLGADAQLLGRRAPRGVLVQHGAEGLLVYVRS